MFEQENDGYGLTLQEASSAWAREPESTEPVVAEAAAAAPVDAGAAVDPVAGAEAAVAAAASTGNAEATQEAVEYLEALLGEEKQQLRADLRLPIKINGTDEMVSLSELRGGYQRTQDYTRKTMALAEDRRSLETERRHWTVEQRTIAAQKEMVAADHQKLIEAQSDPDKFSKYLDHVDRLDRDPDYKEVYERSERLKMREVQDATMAEVDAEEQQENMVRDITDFAVGLSGDDKYKGKVTPDHALALYNEWLIAGTATLHSRDLRRAFDALLTQRDRTIGPLERELDTLRGSVAEMQAQMAAKDHNGRVRTRVAASSAARTPVGSPSTGATGTPRPVGRVAGRETLQERSAAWAKA